MSHLICSHCGSIQSLTEDLNLESGATYPCEECRKASIVLVLTPEQYVEVVQFLSHSKRNRADQIKQLLEFERYKGIVQHTKKFHKKLMSILTGQTPETEKIVKTVEA